MIGDRELYVLIAKAAGITGYVCEDWNGPYFCTPANPEIPRSEPVFYRWLHDDGDTLRLAVRLNLQLHCGSNLNRVSAADRSDFEPFFEYYDSDGAGKEVAMRRVVASAAAAIGKAMP